MPRRRSLPIVIVTGSRWAFKRRGFRLLLAGCRLRLCTSARGRCWPPGLALFGLRVAGLAGSRSADHGFDHRPESARRGPGRWSPRRLVAADDDNRPKGAARPTGRGPIWQGHHLGGPRTRRDRGPAVALLTQYFGWPRCFLKNHTCRIIAVILAAGPAACPAGRPVRRRRHVDVRGAALLV